MVKDQDPPAPDPWPKLSVLVPARNEATTLKDAMSTLLAQDYPDMEVVLVDDRSTDGTEEVVDRLAASDPRVTPVHVGELPEGWLGKVHALERARRKATGDWLLFTDADVHFAAGTLRKAVAFCLAQGRDHLTVIPAVPTAGFWLGVTLSSLVYLCAINLRFDKVGRPGSKTVVGLGSFNLVRAAKLDQTEGLAGIRMDITDDYALALLLHRAGARSALLGGNGTTSVVWYPTLRAMVKGLDKCLAAARYSYLNVAAAALVLFAGVVGPVLGLFLNPAWFLRPLVLATYAAVSCSAALVGRRIGRPMVFSFFLPFGLPIIACGVLRAGFNCWLHGGVIWRGTLYRREQLRCWQTTRP